MKLHIEDLNDLSYIIKISAQQVVQRFPTGFNNGRFRTTKSL